MEFRSVRYVNGYLKKVFPRDFPIASRAWLSPPERQVSFIEGNREDGLKFELSLEDHAKLSRKALESGCSLEELVARHLHSIL